MESSTDETPAVEETYTDKALELVKFAVEEALTTAVLHHFQFVAHVSTSCTVDFDIDNVTKKSFGLKLKIYPGSYVRTELTNTPEEFNSDSMQMIPDKKPDVATLRLLSGVEGTLEVNNSTNTPRKRGRPKKTQDKSYKSPRQKKKSTEEVANTIPREDQGKEHRKVVLKLSKRKKKPSKKITYKETESDSQISQAETEPGDEITLSESDKPIICKREAVDDSQEEEMGGSLQCPICNDMLDNMAAMREHNKTVHCTGWSCPWCVLPHPSRDRLNAHVQEMHPEHADAKLFTCEKCEMVFPEETKLTEHHMLSHVFECDHCGETFPNVNRLATHMKKLHPEHALTCNICQRVVPSQAALLKHIKRHKEKLMGGYECDICHKRFTAKSTLYHHKRGIHQKRKHTCEECGMTFNFHQSLRLHRHKHTGKRPYPCEHCDKAYLTASHLKDHVMAAHSVEHKFKCKVCDKTFPYDNSLRMHMLRHKEERPFCCDVCGKTFVSNSALATHEQLHAGKTFPCDICSKEYKTIGLLKSHKRRHTEDGKRYMCDICGNTFMYASTLAAHKAVHGDERAFQCNICDQRFKTSSSLYSHRLVHSDENPYRCHTCGKCFKTKERIKAHEKRHLGEKPFTCELCGSSFPDRGGLSKHVKTVHSSAAKYKCPVCGKTANRADNLRVHMKAHGNPALLKLTQQQLLDTSSAIQALNDMAKTSPNSHAQNTNTSNIVINTAQLVTDKGQMFHVVENAPALGTTVKQERNDNQMHEIVVGNDIANTVRTTDNQLFYVQNPSDKTGKILLPYIEGNVSQPQTQPADLSTHAQSAEQHVTILAPPTNNQQPIQTFDVITSGSNHALNVQNNSVHNLTTPIIGTLTNAQQIPVAQNTETITSLESAQSGTQASNLISSTNAKATHLGTITNPPSNPLLTLAEVLANAQMQNSPANQQLPRVVNVNETGLDFNSIQHAQFIPYSVASTQAENNIQYSFQPTN